MRKTGWVTAVISLVAWSCSAPESPSQDAGVTVDAGARTDVAAQTDASPDANAQTGPLSWDFRRPGPYRVGHRSFDVTYEPVTAVSRTIKIHVWYPTEDTEGVTAKYGAFFDKGSFEGASLAPSAYDSGTYPLHVHSHGRQGYGGASVDILRHFVSHGWVAAAPDHASDTIFDAEIPLSVPVYYQRLLDLRETLDLLEELPADDPLTASVQTEGSLLSGHSLGAFLSWAATGATFDEAKVRAKCSEVDAEATTPCTDPHVAAFADVEEPRFAASIATAGVYREDWYTDGSWSNVTIPVLTLTGSDDQVGQADQWARISGIDHTWIDFVDVCHGLFSVGTCPRIDRQRGLAAINAYALAFSRQRILGDDSEPVGALLSGEARLEDDIVGVFER